MNKALELQVRFAARIYGAQGCEARCAVPITPHIAHIRHTNCHPSEGCVATGTNIGALSIT